MSFPFGCSMRWHPKNGPWVKHVVFLWCFSFRCSYRFYVFCSPQWKNIIYHKYHTLYKEVYTYIHAFAVIDTFTHTHTLALFSYCFGHMTFVICRFLLQLPKEVIWLNLLQPGGVTTPENDCSSPQKKQGNEYLGGGFKYFLFSPLFGEMIQFD